MLGEAGDAGVGVGRDGRIVLVEVLQRERVFLRGVVVEVGHSHVGREAAGAGKEGVVEVRRGRRRTVQAVVGDEPLPGSPEAQAS